MKNILHFRHSLALATLFVLFLMPGLGWGQTTIFTESMGTVSGTTAIAAHETANGFDNDAYTMTNGGATNSADIRATSPSSGYTGSSGLANVWFTSTSGSYGFAIEGIDASSYTNLSIQFGYRKELGAALPTLAIDYWNGTSYVNVPFTFTENASAAVGWYLSPVISLPAGAQIANLKIRLVKSGTVAVRVDDIKLSGILSSPSVTTSSATNIAITTATGNGNITATGGSNATTRGFCWDFFANPDPDITDTHSTESGSFGTGTFTGSITSLSVETRYKTVAYATNPTGTGYGSAVNFWTLSNEPAAHSTTFSSSAISQVQIDLSYDAASTITNADGYIILQKTGSAPTGVPVDATAYTTGNTIGDATVAAIVNSTSSTSTSITGLSAGTHYYFTIIPFNYNGTNNETYNYLTTGTIPGTNATTTAALDATSEVSGPALVGQPDPVTISSTITTLATAVKVFDMDIYDYGTTDALPTKITQLTIYPGSNNTCNWASTIEGIRLSADGGSTFITTGTPVITNASIVIPVTSGNLDIPDGDALTVSLFVYLKTTVVDNSVLEFKVLNTGHGFVADLTGSTFLTAFTTAPTSNQILIDVIATQLSFTTQPSGNACPNTNLLTPPVISAYDANNNLDADFIGQVTLTNSGSIPMANYQMNAIDGIANFSTLQFVQTGDITLSTTNTSSLTNAGPSSSVLISVASVTSPLASNGDASSVLTWTNPTCYDEIMIVAKQGSAVTGSPSGDGTSYTANLVFGTSGTEFGTSDGYVVYKGSTSPQTVTSLTNGQTYHFSYFTRKGTNWSAVVTATAIPAPAVFTFRSVASGNWNVVGTWQSSPNGTIWTDATATPGPTNDVFIQSGHIVTLTQNEACKDLHISKGTSISNNTLGMIAVQTFSLSVNGKLRNYYAAVNTTPGTSYDTYASYPFTGTTGKVLIVGNSRILTNTGEWGATINNPGTGIFPLEINLNSGQTIEIQTSVKTTSFNLLNGTFNASANTISVATGTPGEGNITIGTGTILSSSATGTSTKVFQRTGSTLGGVLTVDGTLKLSGTSPNISMTTINFNGIVEYNGTGAQNFAVAANSGMNPNTYTNLILNNSTGVTMGMNIDVNGNLNLLSGVLNTGAYTITLGASGSVTGNNSSNYINGKLACIFSAAGSKTFPTGKGTNYRPVTFNYTSLTGSSTVTVEQIEGALPGSIPSGNTLFSTRYWTITESGSTAGAYKVTLDGTGFSPTGAVKMLKGDGTTNLVYAVTGTAPSYTNQTDFTSFSNFGLAEFSGTPTITSFTPNGACAGASVPVTITGTNFVSVTDVKFNGTSTTFVVNSETEIKADLPDPFTAGPISVTTINGTATSTENFKLYEVPTVNAGLDGSVTQGNTYNMAGTATNYLSSAWTKQSGTGSGTLTDPTILNPVFTGVNTGPCVMKLTVTGYEGCGVVTDLMTIFVTGSVNPLTWNGSVNSDWHNVSNWTPAGFAPGTSSDVGIPAGVPNYPTLSATGVCETVTIAAGASLIDNGFLNPTTTNGVIVEHPAITAGQWHSISPPVAGVVSGMFVDQYLRYYDPVTGQYVEIIPTNVALNAMQGYVIWPVTSQSAAYHGEFNPGTYSYPLSTANGGWNLIGNPYTSSIDWGASTGWDKTNVNNSVYIVKGSSWASYVGGSGTNGGSRYIAPTQGFFIQAIGTSIGMNNSVRVHENATFFKKSDEVVPNLIRLEVSGNDFKDETVIRFKTEATPEFDGNFDAYKFFGDVPEAAQIYSLGSIALSINSLPETNLVPVGLYVGKPGSYTIAATEINDLRYMQLEDTQSGDWIDISNQAYTFNADSGTFEQRFKLHFSLLSTPDDMVDNIDIYSHQKTVYINMLEKEGDMFIYNISGQLVKSQPKIKGMYQVSLPVTGNYIIKVITGKNSIVKKILIP